MKILLVLRRPIYTIPPIRNLLIVLLKNGHEVTVIAQDDAKKYVKDCDRLKSYVVSKVKRNFITRAVDHYVRKHITREIIRSEMQNNDILWVTSDAVMRDVGKLAFQYKYILHLMELVEDIPAIPIENFAPLWIQRLVPLNLKKYARKAYKVVVAEYNRAHIEKVWWGLERIPEIWPNKPVDESVQEENAPIEVRKILSRLKREKRKIILYQGGFVGDRDLDILAQTIDEVPEEYCLYLMGRETPYLEDLCRRYNNIQYIPFVEPPYHLLITKYAYIGLLPYRPKQLLHVSVLNALYCAPNKIFEYAKQGVPMLGSDVVGLEQPFSKYQIGYCYKETTPKAIMDEIRRIEENHENMSENCKKFYDSVNLSEVAEKILSEKTLEEIGMQRETRNDLGGVICSKSIIPAYDLKFAA